MKNSILLVLMLFVTSICFAQSTNSTVPGSEINTSIVQASTKPLSDSMRQVMHKIFKRGRLFSTVGAVAGATMFGSSLGYIIGGRSDWTTGVNLTLGASTTSYGVTNMIQFNRRHERAVIAALERGEPLPESMVQWVAFLGQRSKNRNKK